MWLIAVCSASFFVAGLVCGPVLVALTCAAYKKCKRRRSRLYGGGAGKMAECPVYEDIGPQVVNKVHFELEKNEAYGHVN